MNTRGKLIVSAALFGFLLFSVTLTHVLIRGGDLKREMHTLRSKLDASRASLDDLRTDLAKLQKFARRTRETGPDADLTDFQAAIEELDRTLSEHDKRLTALEQVPAETQEKVGSDAVENDDGHEQPGPYLDKGRYRFLEYSDLRGEDRAEFLPWQNRAVFIAGPNGELGVTTVTNGGVAVLPNRQERALLETIAAIDFEYMMESDRVIERLVRAKKYQYFENKHEAFEFMTSSDEHSVKVAVGSGYAVIRTADYRCPSLKYWVNQRNSVGDALVRSLENSGKLKGGSGFGTTWHGGRAPR